MKNSVGHQLVYEVMEYLDGSFWDTGSDERTDFLRRCMAAVAGSEDDCVAVLTESYQDLYLLHVCLSEPGLVTRIRAYVHGSAIEAWPSFLHIIYTAFPQIRPFTCRQGGMIWFPEFAILLGVPYLELTGYGFLPADASEWPDTKDLDPVQDEDPIDGVILQLAAAAAQEAGGILTKAYVSAPGSPHAIPVLGFPAVGLFDDLLPRSWSGVQPIVCPTLDVWVRLRSETDQMTWPSMQKIDAVTAGNVSVVDQAGFRHGVQNDGDTMLQCLLMGMGSQAGNDLDQRWASYLRYRIEQLAAFSEPVEQFSGVRRIAIPGVQVSCWLFRCENDLFISDRILGCICLLDGFLPLAYDTQTRQKTVCDAHALVRSGWGSVLQHFQTGTLSGRQFPKQYEDDHFIRVVGAGRHLEPCEHYYQPKAGWSLDQLRSGSSLLEIGGSDQYGRCP